MACFEGKLRNCIVVDKILAFWGCLGKINYEERFRPESFDNQ